MSKEKALVLFSGGQDSTTVLAEVIKIFGKDNVVALNMHYGQRHEKEIGQARKIAELLKVTLVEKSIEGAMKDFSGGALIDNTEIKPVGGYANLPTTFAPGRNILFITLASMYAFIKGIDNIYVGVSQVDYSGYPDCRDNVLNSLIDSLNEGVGFKDEGRELIIHKPLINKTKAETFKMADKLGVLHIVTEYSLTCYNGDMNNKWEWGYGCNTCPACELRRKGYEEYVNERDNNR